MLGYTLVFLLLVDRTQQYMICTRSLIVFILEGTRWAEDGAGAFGRAFGRAAA